MRNFNQTEQSGRSMVEMLGVLAIIGVLSVGGISGYSKAMAKYKASKAMDQLSLLIANIRTAYSTMSNYDGLGDDTARKYAIASRDMYQTGHSSALVNAFGGKLEIVSTTYNDITSAGFAIAYNGLNDEACVQLATADWGTGGLAAVKVSSSAVDLSSGEATPTTKSGPSDGSGTFLVADMPVSLANAYLACGTTAGNSKSIVWYFY